MASSTALPLALLIIYITFSLPVIYVAIKHGFKHGAIVGWFFLFAFCTLKIVSSAIEMNDPHSSGAVLVGSIGLSPLLAAFCGVLHEARAYIIPKSRRPCDLAYLIIFHLLVTTAIAIIASGASDLSKTTLSPDQINRDNALVKAGIVMLFVGWISLAILTIMTFRHISTRTSGKLADNGAGKKLLLAVAVSIPFLGIRVLERLVYYFTQNPLLDPISGSFGLRVGLEVVEEIIVTLLLVVAGVLTRNIGSVAATDVN
ncbi:hypothetical protein F5Y04DRAFT_99237 [Hypomontagnella monticulosa]|nr:hypothetical protein F5Y04DRAFT_99237 [Hypomontagnella monticulosa]